jgi:hypothetical protein
VQGTRASGKRGWSNTIQAGEPDFGGSCHCVFGVLTSGPFSRHRLSFAENYIRVPHIGGPKVEHLMSNIEALKFTQPGAS